MRVAQSQSSYHKSVIRTFDRKNGVAQKKNSEFQIYTNFQVKIQWALLVYKPKGK